MDWPAPSARPTRCSTVTRCSPWRPGSVGHQIRWHSTPCWMLAATASPGRSVAVLPGGLPLGLHCYAPDRLCHVTVPGPVRHETEGPLFFLCVVQPEHGIQPVEQAPELDDVLGLGGLAVESCEKPS